MITVSLLGIGYEDRGENTSGSGDQSLMTDEMMREYVSECLSPGHRSNRKLETVVLYRLNMGVFVAVLSVLGELSTPKSGYCVLE